MTITYLNPPEIAGLIDHTLLKPEATPEQIRQLCQEARQWGFYSVCINPVYTLLAATELSGANIKVATVIAFPLGATSSAIKAAETREAVANGADEVDMVMPVGLLLAGETELVKKDISRVVMAAGAAPVKVILETALLKDEEIVTACRLAREAGAHFVKTSTGMGPGGATSRHVSLMRQTVGPELGVKASGGIRSLDTLLEMVKAGANRIGTSSGVSIMKAANSTL